MSIRIYVNFGSLILLTKQHKIILEKNLIMNNQKSSLYMNINRVQRNLIISAKRIWYKGQNVQEALQEKEKTSTIFPIQVSDKHEKQKHGCTLTSEETSIHNRRIFVAAHSPYQWCQEDIFNSSIDKDRRVRIKGHKIIFKNTKCTYRILSIQIMMCKFL